MLSESIKEEMNMARLTEAAEQIMMERFGKDNVISLATVDKDQPYVRSVNAFYEDGAFYVLTYELSGKMNQIARNPHVAISGDWFTAQGLGVNLGSFCSKANMDISAKMKKVFAGWINNGHSNLTDEHTCILKIKLTTGILFSHGTRYDIDFDASYDCAL